MSHERKIMKSFYNECANNAKYRFFSTHLVDGEDWPAPPRQTHPPRDAGARPPPPNPHHPLDACAGAPIS
jgi:hypothetical protein